MRRPLYFWRLNECTKFEAPRTQSRPTIQVCMGATALFLTDTCTPRCTHCMVCE